MGKIIRLEKAAHEETRWLLPWYVTERLDAAERARVEAHLAGCLECQEELRSERQLERDVAELPLDIELGWAAMRRRLSERPGLWVLLEGFAHGATRLARESWLGWAVAAPLALMLAISALTPKLQPPAVYHALSAPASTRFR